jgi:exopolysaccharide biosynthesis polyprenyl glycosylphosphotransferase
MKNNSSLVYSLLLILGDFLALAAAFTTAYVYLFKYIDRPNIQLISANEYAVAFLTVLPFWIAIHGLLGLYGRNVYENRFREFGRLIVGSFIGIMLVISYDFLSPDVVFPGKLVLLVAFIIGFGYLLLFRSIARLFRTIFFTFNVGVTNVLIVGGENDDRSGLMNEIQNTRHTGYKIVGVVGKAKKFQQFENFDAALEGLQNTPIHTIIQTQLYKDGVKNDEIMNYAQNNHITYRFIPGNSELFIGNIEVELFRGTPVVTVHQTALVGWGQIVKRLFDIFASSVLLLLAAPLMLLVAIAGKLLNPGESLLFKQTRLTQFDRPFTVYKFRSQYQRFDGTTPEEAFSLIGKPELAKQYRLQGDYIKNDPRITRMGKFIRTTSLDELPQLFNVLKGDISLIGPRALIPAELKNYPYKHHILSVRSGLTGLAQVSGRRDLSFEERRKLDAYYVQNWSFWLDLTILLKTIRAVLSSFGAK